MWQPLYSLPPIPPSNTRRIECECANPCPERLGRLDWIERRKPSMRSTHTRWHHRPDSLMLVSSVAVVSTGPSADTHTTLTEQGLRLSNGVADVSSSSMAELARLGADRISQSGALTRDSAPPLVATELNQALLVLEDKSTLLKVEQQEVSECDGAGEDGTEREVSEEICAAQSRVESNGAGHSKVGLCDVARSASGVQSGDAAQWGTVQSRIMRSDIEQGALSCEVGISPLECQLVQDSAGPYPWPCNSLVSPRSSVKSLSDLRVSAGVRYSQLDARMLQKTLPGVMNSCPMDTTEASRMDLDLVPCPLVNVTEETGRVVLP